MSIHSTKFILELWPDIETDSPVELLEYALTSIRNNPELRWDIQHGSTIHRDVKLGDPSWWERPLGTTEACEHCGKAIQQASGIWYHADSGLPPCDPSKVDPEAYTDVEGHKYDIATPSKKENGR